VHDLEGGLRVEYRAGGQVAVTGVDRWGAKLEQTYESAAYFKAAIPVLSNYVKPAQAEALKRLAGDLVEEAPAK
jgi:hypothetical protein